jgi:hypothetical protein
MRPPATSCTSTPTRWTCTRTLCPSGTAGTSPQTSTSPSRTSTAAPSASPSAVSARHRRRRAESRAEGSHRPLHEVHHTEGPQGHRARRPVRLYRQRPQHDRAEGRGHGQRDLVPRRDRGGARLFPARWVSFTSMCQSLTNSHRSARQTHAGSAGQLARCPQRGSCGAPEHAHSHPWWPQSHSRLR